MDDSPTSVLAARLNRRIARRQRFARWGTHLVIPTIGLTVFLARWGQGFILAGLILLMLEGIAIGSGRLLRCPRCGEFLVTGRRGETKFLEECLECGYLVE
jgi:hypothetical protein